MPQSPSLTQSGLLLLLQQPSWGLFPHLSHWLKIKPRSSNSSILTSQLGNASGTKPSLATLSIMPGYVCKSKPQPFSRMKSQLKLLEVVAINSKSLISGDLNLVCTATPLVTTLKTVAKSHPPQNYQPLLLL
ncbi:hypothetical protein QJS10_CPB12g00683 [Acorus calamus]|uniref:Uncharacterized protein n=1 Tax=Acorus calamus TaxID=4465 RepID=A0AAV9DN96_ACOCL|nr:hypothetical protein QJS10_CPB12g00683 [Acorus calamus]